MKLVLCHGCFDILHIGHFRHLKEARGFGDRLVVSITAARFVAKGSGHPALDDEERAFQLRALRYVDEVHVVEGPTGAPAILKYQPAVFVKGCDYAEKGISPAEVEACRAVGARIRYTRSKKRSVAELIQKFIERRKS